MRSAAPVNAPFSCPNSSDSSSDLGQRGAVDRDEWLAPPRREIVNCLGDQLLAGAGLALDQYGARDRRHLLHPDQQLLDRGALARYPGALLQLTPDHQPLDQRDVSGG